MNEVIEDVFNERKRQDQKWGEQNHHPYKWMSILSEEVGEASEAVLQSNLSNFYNEIVQVAAVSISILEAIKRGKWTSEDITRKE